MNRDFLNSAKTIVVKVGSAVLTDEKGLNHSVISELSRQISWLCKEGRKVVLVSSGAIAAGIGKMPGRRRPRTIPEKQALAAIGQGYLMQTYEEAFEKHGFQVAQVLLTREGLVPRHRYVNAKNTLRTLMDWNVVPIINENDTVAVEELQFTDNDALAVLVVNLAEADLLICLSDVDCLYDSDPAQDPGARPLMEVSQVDRHILEMAGDNPGRAGRGGMKSKLEAARMVTACGVPMIVAGGRTTNILERLMTGEQLGTLFTPQKRRKIHGRKPWIVFTLAREGSLELDRGAVAALLDNGKSLLPVGVKGVNGNFPAGACVTCKGPDGQEIAVGLSNYSSEELKKICGCKTNEVCDVIGHREIEEVIHRDDLVTLD